MSRPLVFARRTGDSVATVTITPDGDRMLRFDLHIDGKRRDTDIVQFDTRGDRDRNLNNVTAEYLDNGYTQV